MPFPFRVIEIQTHSFPANDVFFVVYSNMMRVVWLCLLLAAARAQQEEEQGMEVHKSKCLGTHIAQW